LYTLCALALMTSSCKTDGTAVAKVQKATYPTVWAEKEVPAFVDGLITNDKFDNSERKIEHVVWLETEKTMEEIYQWHKTSFSQAGWKNVRNKRSDIGEDTESILMVHTKGSVKHNVVVLKHTIRTNQIKTILSYF
ncbi:hypothetical protein N9B82_06320, partial [Saprospiraceae bacterium]|nr:hypothetical protein [Saprospiraceae bacterium]